MKKFGVCDSNMVKGFAIILMVYHHLFRLPEFSAQFNLSFYPFNVNFIAELTTFFKLCVPLFVFISGYGLLYAYKKVKNKGKFFIQRCIKFLPTFWVIAILAAIFLEYKHSYVSFLFFQEDIISGVFYFLFNILGISGLIGTPMLSDNWWYIGANFVFIFLVPVIYNLAKRFSWFSVGLGIFLIPRMLNLGNISTTSALPFIFTLFLGMYAQDTDLLEKIKNKEVNKNHIINKFIKFIMYIFVLFIGYIYCISVERTAVWELHFGLVPLIVIAFLYEFASNIKPIAYLLAVLGEHSYMMFLIHGFIYTFYPSFVYGTSHFIISGIYVLVISFVISFILKTLLTKFKYYSCFKSLEDKLIS